MDANEVRRAGAEPVERSRGVRFALAMVVLGCVLPLSIFAAILIFYFVDREQDRIADSVTSRARAMVSVVDREFASIHASLLALDTSNSLKRGDMEVFRERALLALANMKAASIFVLDQDGQMTMTTWLPTGVTLPMMEKPTLFRLMERTRRPVVSDLFVGPVGGEPMIAVGIPLLRDDVVFGSLNASLQPSQFLDLLKEQRIDPDWRVAIVDSSGTVVARTHDMARFLGGKVAPELLDRLSRISEGAFPSRTLDGVPVVTVYSRSPLSRWAVVIGIPRTELRSSLLQSLAWLIVAALTALGVGLVLAFRVGGRIAQSISALAHPGWRTGTGDADDLPRLHFREAVELGSAMRDASVSLERARHEAQHDGLTGLPNRVHFNEAVERALASCKASQHPLALLVIDLDGFKQVNDSLGHSAGDELLRQVAIRLRGSIRASDIAARLGGDEFAVCLPDSPVEGARRTASKLIDILSRPYTLPGLEATISASIGLATYSSSADTVDGLIEQADRAMYQAKSDGKNQLRLAATNTLDAADPLR